MTNNNSALNIEIKVNGQKLETVTSFKYSDTRIFRVPRVCRRTLGERSFQYIGPVIWNTLSVSVRHATTLSSFKSKLKTHLFSSAY